MLSYAETLGLSLALAACSDPPAPEVASRDAGADSAVDAAVDAALDTGEPVPDLRFKWVGQTGRYLLSARSNVDSYFSSGLGFGFSGQGAIGPVQVQLGVKVPVSPSDDDAGSPRYVSAAWYFFRVGTERHFESLESPIMTGPMVSLDSEIADIIDAKQFITSLDIVTTDDAVGAFAVVSVGVTAERALYDVRSAGKVTRASLAASVAQDAERGLVTTALAGDGELIRTFAYNWIGDTQHYETDVREAKLEDLEARARELAEAGYIITAFGKDGETLLLVGTRLAGTATPHEISLVSGEPPRESDGAPVGWVYTPSSETLLFER